MSIVILDNGGGTVKAGVIGKDSSIARCHTSPPVIVPNATAKPGSSSNSNSTSLVGDQISQFYQSSNGGTYLHFTRSFERGYITNWQCEIDVWKYIFHNKESFESIVRPGSSQQLRDGVSLILTEPPLNPPSIQNDSNEIVFEYFEFSHLLRRSSTWFSAYEHFHSIGSEYKCCMVVDSGFSFSHAVPYVDSVCPTNAIRRVNVGGKLLTNYLKEIISYRQWNMMDEFWLVNQVKEDLCYVSSNFMPDLKMARTQRLLDPFGGRLKKNFLLPDFAAVMRGFVKPDDELPAVDEQVLTMDTERFAVPELLFQPSDIGINQAGIVEATWQSLQKLPMVDMALCSANIVLTGGNSKFHNFKERFEKEIRTFIPAHMPVNVYMPPDPDTYAWRGAQRFALDEVKKGALLSKHMVSRQQYLENGHYYCNKKFANY